LERSQVVDLLPTRSADSFGEWLAQHPEVTTVSRDRQGVYAEGSRRGAPKAVQVADRFHLILNLTQAVERELAVNRRHLRIACPSAPALPLSSTTDEVKIQTEQIRVRSSIVLQQMEVARQRRQQKLELFRTIKRMRAAGTKVSQIARQLGLCRRRIDKWIQLDKLPERSRMQPRSGMPESIRDYLRQRWEAGCRHGRTLFAEIRRFTKKNLQHPTYKAFAKLGKAIKTIFLCRYLHSDALRSEIHEGLNVVEQWNGATDFVFFARRGEMVSNRQEDTPSSQ
jgi:transposase